MSEIGVYFETWASKWVGKAEDMDLGKVDKPISIVYLAFANPKCTYVKGSNSFAGTGLDFCQDFSVVRGAIGILKQKGIKVMLAVGGGSYWSAPSAYNAEACVNLANDLGCDGIDIDWEVGVRDELALVEAIQKTRPLLGGKKLSFCGFSTGAYPKTNDSGNPFPGMNVLAIQKCGSMVDWINIMCYDAGKDFDAVGAYMSYRKIYSGPLMLGFEIGKQGWGDALLKKDEVLKSCGAVVKDGKKNGVFLWAYFSQGGDGISRADTVKVASEVFNSDVPVPPVSPVPPPKPTYSCPSSVFILCPGCGVKIRTAWSKE